MSTYRPAEDEAVVLGERLMAEHCQDLLGAGVRIGYLFAHAARDPNTGEPKGDALKFQGYKAAGVVKVTSQEARAAGHPDVIIKLDGDEWPDWPDETRMAVIHHELHHVELWLDDEGEIKLDECNRPKLKLQPHDWQLGGFARIAELYGPAAPEVDGAVKMAKLYGEVVFGEAVPKQEAVAT